MIEVTPEAMARYRETVRRRQQARAIARAERRARAWAVARQAASLLTHEFGATAIAASTMSCAMCILSTWTPIRSAY